MIYNPAVDLKACSEVIYERKGDAHGVKYDIVCEDGEEGWTPVNCCKQGEDVKFLHV